MAGKPSRARSWWIGLALLAALPAACEFDPSGVPEIPVVGEPDPTDPTGDVDAAPSDPPVPGDVDAAPPLPPDPPDAAPPPAPSDAAPPPPEPSETFMESCEEADDCEDGEVCRSMGPGRGRRCTLECKPTPPGAPDGCPGDSKCGKDGYCVP